MGRKSATAGRGELEVLKYVAEHGPITVGEVAKHVAETSGKARTTTLTVMERLRAKGLLTRKKVQGVYHYETKQSGSDLLRGLVEEFVQRVLGGSVSPFVAYLAEEATLDNEAKERLRQLVRELDETGEEPA